MIRWLFEIFFKGKDTEFVIERALKNNNKIHPDSHLASFLFYNNIKTNNIEITNRYIGTTLLCCIYFQPCQIGIHLISVGWVDIPNLDENTGYFRNFQELDRIIRNNKVRQPKIRYSTNLRRNEQKYFWWHQ